MLPPLGLVKFDVQLSITLVILGSFTRLLGEVSMALSITAVTLSLGWLVLASQMAARESKVLFVLFLLWTPAEPGESVALCL